MTSWKIGGAGGAIDTNDDPGAADCDDRDAGGCREDDDELCVLDGDGEGDVRR